MEAREYVEKYKKMFDPIFKTYIDKKIKKMEEVDVLGGQALRMIKHFVLSGGKRIRPAIMYYSYIGNGGTDDGRDEILKTSISIELVHAFLLIHDDIIDKDDVRHGVPTIHERYKKIAKKMKCGKKKNIGDIDHFANSMAIMVGDMAASMANEVIFNANFSPEKIIVGLDALQKVVYNTVPGEMVDVMMEFQGKATEKEIIRMHEGKTARYTFEGPIHLGWTLADDGSRDSKENLKYLSRYALLAGKAFQVRDDILGVFGNAKKLGKPVGSDIIEGKQTLLMLKALEFCSKKDGILLKNAIGNVELKEAQLDQIRDIIKKTGSLDYSIKLSQSMVGEAITHLGKVKFKDDEAADFFQSIAHFIIERKI